MENSKPCLIPYSLTRIHLDSPPSPQPSPPSATSSRACCLAILTRVAIHRNKAQHHQHQTLWVHRHASRRNAGYDISLIGYRTSQRASSAPTPPFSLPTFLFLDIYRLGNPLLVAHSPRSSRNAPPRPLLQPGCNAKVQPSYTRFGPRDHTSRPGWLQATLCGWDSGVVTIACGETQWAVPEYLTRHLFRLQAGPGCADS
ncbi:hypothetical protein B0J13DRAFT_2947 [Dactylonectria estremocensis]|uniref:Uncharacterized protein n=1 Tax=Dactylonectria estremocensis TaxID=1079267 RepID=A0A9P9FJN8_9HYPO|nr:hypothetical protein B0J13DRAFT_2947 [Dactylonectria estremocensis]